jgi:hypothetical protein
LSVVFKILALDRWKVRLRNVPSHYTKKEILGGLSILARLFFFCPSQNFGLIVIMSLWSWVPILLVLLNISCNLWADWKFQKTFEICPQVTTN